MFRSALLYLTRIFMSPSCPISNRPVDSNIVRIISGQVLLFTMFYLLTGISVWMVIVLVDFVMRGMRKNRYSLFYRIANFIVSKRKIPPRYTDEAPKRFALSIGIFAASTILLFSFLEYSLVAYTVTVILMICAFLEAAFDFCIGCKLYYALQLLKVIKNDRNFN